MKPLEIPSALQDELRAAWQRYLDLLNPLRPDLYRYCRRLTRDLWDAEDLVQETLIRAFGSLGKHHPAVEKPRAYLLRTATNCWIDTLRRREGEARALAATLPAPSPEPPGAVRDAGAVLMRHLSPQERAAVLLKDVFELDLAETAEVLQTTPGAVKAALHRGRARLREAERDPEATRRPLPPAELVDRFVTAYNARDLEGLTSLLLDHASVEQLGCAYSSGRKALEEGFLDKALNGHPEWPASFQYESARLERTLLSGEPIALGMVVRRGREALEQVMRFEEEAGHVVRIRTYAFCPEVMREIGERLGVPVRTGLYRYPTPAPGESY
jgi:RNA polymerase sigma-70 factor (ECF subfamily)